jgi:AraC family transcriptional regulator
MNWLKTLNSSLDYIEEHITEKIDCEDVAKNAFSSYYHFMRMFFVLSGLNLGEYIRNRRLTLAASDLVSSNEKIIDIALKYQYNTPESFSKAFKRFHGVTPRKAKLQQPELKMFSKLTFQIKLQGDYLMNYKIIKKNEITFKGIQKNISTNDGQNFVEIPKLWDEVMQNGVYKSLLEKADDMGVVGICYDHDNEKNIFKYMIGIANEDAMIEKSTTVTFEPQTYAAFKSVGALPKAIQNTIGQIYSEWFPSSNFEHSGGPEFEVYTPGNAHDDNYVCYYWVPIVKKS